MTFEQLRLKAASLPTSPGVYIMRDKADAVIYVGKAKILRNRVSQYFQISAAHTPKTRLMISRIDHFEVIVAASEFEALILECSLIKRHMPKYNIMLKDDKGFPYIRLDMAETYPTITMVSKPGNDRADYYGPFGSRSVTQAIIEAIVQALKLPSCKKKFPADVGKGRPCLNYHMNQCAGWCQKEMTSQQYRDTMEQARHLLLGNFKQVTETIRADMLQASDSMNFELAASLRDRLHAVENLNKKQLVTACSMADTDVIGYGKTETKACFAVLHFRGGNLLDKDYEVFALPEDDISAVSALVKQYYISKEYAPKNILLPFDIEDRLILESLFVQKYGKKITVRLPQRGDKAKMVELACKNAYDEALRVTSKEERISGALTLLGKMLSMEPPARIESFDISNISGTDIVASMVIFQDGKPRKSDYKRFKLEGMDDQNDYGSMRQVLTRRFTHYASNDAGFEQLPDLLLVDGGAAHAKVACEVLAEHNIQVPVFGMVKDDRHRTRALITQNSKEIRIDSQQSVFSLIGTIQEETHRFAISYHRMLRSKRLKYSELDTIQGIGPKRKQALLKKFKSINMIAAASVNELERILPRDAAAAVYQHFKMKKGEN